MTRLDSEIATLESNPVMAQRRKAIDEVRQDYQAYVKIVHEL